ncbi:hypothetical protein BGW39_007421 [Mortierella sp. 14UC]|nr:hypothetical protein BGW39_007421 [Mortierella sp. 14UC]
MAEAAAAAAQEQELGRALAQKQSQIESMEQDVAVTKNTSVIDAVASTSDNDNITAKDVSNIAQGSLCEVSPAVLDDQSGVVDLIRELESGEWDLWGQRDFLGKFYEGTNPALGPQSKIFGQFAGCGVGNQEEFPVMLEILITEKDTRHTSEACRWMYELWYQCQMELRKRYSPLHETEQSHRNRQALAFGAPAPFLSSLGLYQIHFKGYHLHGGEWSAGEVSIFKESIERARKKASIKLPADTDKGDETVKPAPYDCFRTDYLQDIDQEGVFTLYLPWREPEECANVAYKNKI